MTVKIRYKKSNENKSKLIIRAINQDILSIDKTSDNYRFATSVAEFCLLLRDSKYKGDASFYSVLERAEHTMEYDKYGYRKEFLKLVKIAKGIAVKYLKLQKTLK